MCKFREVSPSPEEDFLVLTNPVSDLDLDGLINMWDLNSDDDVQVLREIIGHVYIPLEQQIEVITLD